MTTRGCQGRRDPGAPILAMPMFTGPKPFVVIDLRGPGGNIFAIIARCERLARRAGKPEHEINAFRRAVTSTHSYANALATASAWFDAIIVGRNITGEKKA